MTKTVLAVDDSASIRQMVAFTLKSAGYQVLEAVDGEDGLSKAKGTGVNLVLTDQNMPKMDGLTLVRSLRGLPQVQDGAYPDADHRVGRHHESAGQGGRRDRLAGETVRSGEAGRSREKSDRLITRA